MRVPFVRLFLSALAAAWVASPAHGQTTLTSGNATFTLNDPPDGESSNTYSGVEFRPEGGAAANHLYTQWLFYRAAGDTQVQPSRNSSKTGGGSVAMRGSPSGSTMTYSVTESEGQWDPVHRHLGHPVAGRGRVRGGHCPPLGDDHQSDGVLSHAFALSTT